MNELHVLWLPLSAFALAVLVLVVDVMTPPSDRAPRALGFVVAGGLALLLAATFVVDASGPAAHGAYEASPWATFLQRLFLAAGALAALGGVDDVARRTPRRHGEYWLTLLFSIVGMTILAGARDLLLIVVAFELMGIPLYVLAAYAKNDAPAEGKKGLASEAALKLYLVGATSSATTLFGLGLFAGMAGTTRVAELGAITMTPLAGLGLVMIMAGVGYKIGMVPFHMWVPDTYQGARAPFVAFLSVAPKAAGVAVLATIFLSGMRAHHAHWVPALAMLAFLSMAVGNLLALPQTDVRRLLGYSGIAQMGYVLVALVTNDAFGAGMTLFFLAAYVFTNMGAFLVLHSVSDAGKGFSLDSLAGLSRRSPSLAVALMVFLLSLAGIPFAVGFWAKLYVFLAAWKAGLWPLVVAGIVLAVIALFYYLKVLRAAYMTDGEGGALEAPKPTFALRLAVGACLVAVVGFGLWPRPLVDGAMAASSGLAAPAAQAAQAAR